jgi:hypothetical protein
VIQDPLIARGVFISIERIRQKGCIGVSQFAVCVGELFVEGELWNCKECVPGMVGGQAKVKL